jgi:hypothetical protein
MMLDGTESWGEWMASELKAAATTACLRTQRALQWFILVFFGSMFVVLVVLYLVAPVIYVRALKLGTATASSDSHPLAINVFFVAILAFVVTLGLGTIRRWRWVFWLALIAFLASILDIPAGILQLLGIIPIDQPAWYVILRMAISLVEFALGVWMLRAWRTCGVWAGGRRQRVQGEDFPTS